MYSFLKAFLVLISKTV